MNKSIVTTGKTIDLAIAAALEQLGLDRDSVSVQVLENARTGFLGIGASPAKVEVSYEVPDEEPPKPAPALTSASRKPKKQAPKLEKPLEMPAEKPAAEQPARKPQAAPKKEAPKKAEAPRKQEAPKKAAPAQKPAQPAKEYAPAEADSLEETVEVFLKGLLERMGSDAVPHASRKDSDTIYVELTGDDLGVLIGRRGETLDAIQHLANYTINKDSNKRTRISIDAENYRGKREEALQHLATKMAAKAVRYKRNMTLEPMNAYERHVIHAALQSYPDVTTYSTGTEPNRRIVVAYQKGE